MRGISKEDKIVQKGENRGCAQLQPCRPAQNNNKTNPRLSGKEAQDNIILHISQKTVPETRKGHPEHDEQSLPGDYRPMVSMSQSMPDQFQLEP